MRFSIVYLSLLSLLLNKFDALQEMSETLTSNEEYENFVKAHMEAAAAAAECIPTNLSAKYKTSWETFTVKKKRDNVKTASLCNKTNPTNANTKELKKAQSELINAY